MHTQKRLLLYKHGDDLRQELLAIQFIERCNQILKASGLDLKLKTFRCLPVGAQKVRTQSLTEFSCLLMTYFRKPSFDFLPTGIH